MSQPAAESDRQGKTSAPQEPPLARRAYEAPRLHVEAVHTVIRGDTSGTATDGFGFVATS